MEIKLVGTRSSPREMQEITNAEGLPNIRNSAVLYRYSNFTIKERLNIRRAIISLLKIHKIQIRKANKMLRMTLECKYMPDDPKFLEALNTLIGTRNCMVESVTCIADLFYTVHCIQDSDRDLCPFVYEKDHNLKPKIVTGKMIMDRGKVKSKLARKILSKKIEAAENIELYLEERNAMKILKTIITIIKDLTRPNAEIRQADFYNIVLYMKILIEFIESQIRSFDLCIKYFSVEGVGDEQKEWNGEI